MDKKKTMADIFIMLALIVLISLFHYLSAKDNVLLHGIYRRLYYIPIIYAAAKLGPIGVVFSALLSGFLFMLTYLPQPGLAGSLMFYDHSLETIMYGVIGLVVSIVVQLEKESKVALEKAHQDLMKKEEMKSKFISIVAHEFRTPLTILNGYISLFEEGLFKDKEEEFKKKCAKAKDIINRYLQTVNNVLEMVKTEKRDRIERREDLNLNELIKQVGEELLPFAEKRKQEISFILDEKLPILKANRSDLVQVINNLVMNAIKFTPDGGKIKITTQPKPKEIQVEISDTGIGIQESEFENIFESFYEIKPSDQHTTGTYEFQSGSLGLGLAIVKGIVELYGGKIWLTSTIGQGSTFYFTIPLK